MDQIYVSVLSISIMKIVGSHIGFDQLFSDKLEKGDL